MLTFKVRAFPGADAVWNKVITEASGEVEGEEDEVVRIDPQDKQFERQSKEKCLKSLKKNKEQSFKTYKKGLRRFIFGQVLYRTKILEITQSAFLVS